MTQTYGSNELLVFTPNILAYGRTSSLRHCVLQRRIEYAYDAFQLWPVLRLAHPKGWHKSMCLQLIVTDAFEKLVAW